MRFKKKYLILDNNALTIDTTQYDWLKFKDIEVQYGLFKRTFSPAS